MDFNRRISFALMDADFALALTVMAGNAGASSTLAGQTCPPHYLRAGDVA